VVDGRSRKKQGLKESKSKEKAVIQADRGEAGDNATEKRGKMMDKSV
jgi:hypothetical protein